MFKKLVITLILLVVLIGCNNDSEETTTICEIDRIHIDNMQSSIDVQIDGNSTVILEAVGDRIVRLEETFRKDVEMFSELLNMGKEEFLRWWEEDEEFVREVFQDTIEISVNEVTPEIDVTNEYFIIGTVIYFDEMSLIDLENYTGETVSYVSLNRKIENIEENLEGVCVKQ